MMTHPEVDGLQQSRDESEQQEDPAQKALEDSVVKLGEGSGIGSDAMAEGARLSQSEILRREPGDWLSLKKDGQEEGEATEKIHTQAEIEEILHKLIPEGFEQVRVINDDKGLFLLEVKVKGSTEENFTTYTYMRKGTVGNNSSIATSIFKYSQDSEGMGGEDVANYKDGEWKFKT